MRALIVWGLPLLILGCGSGDKTTEDTVGQDTGEADTAAEVELELSLGLDQDSVSAGTSVSYTVLLTDEDGESTPVSDATLSSDLESELAVDAASLKPLLAGTHTLVAAVRLDGEDMTAQAQLEVVPAAADWLDLTLGAEEVSAGELLSFTIVGEDAYGNALDVGAATVEADSTYVTVDTDTVRATLVGSYSLTASQDDQSDTEAWTVVPGPAAAVYLRLDEEDLEAGDSTAADIVVTDEFGNEVDADWTITAEGTGEATVDGDEISFETEGIFTITVTVDGTEIDDSISLTIDSSGPELYIDAPGRGTWTTETSLMFTGSLTDAVTGLSEFSIDGNPVSPGSDGDFSERVSLQYGINIIESIALDLDTPEPNRTSDVRAVLQASGWASTISYMSEGLIIRLNEGDGGMGALSALAGDMIDPDTISSLMVGEVASGSCCWGWLSFTASVDSVDMGDIDVVLDTYEPWLRVTAVIHDIDVDGSIGGSFSSGFDLTADAITVEILLEPSVDWGGNIVVSVQSTSVTVSGLVFEASGGAGVLEDIVEFFGVDIDGMIEDQLTSAIETEIASAIPDMVEEAMSGIRLSQSMDIGDNSYTLLAIPERIDIDSAGLDIALKSLVTPYVAVAEGWATSPPGPGLGDFSYPTFAETSGGTEIALGIDFLNQLMYAVWGGGLLDTQMTDEDLGIDVALIALVLPGLEDLTLVTTPTLPPVIVPHEDVEAETDLAMQLGDIYVQIYDGPATPSALYMELYVSAQMPLTLEASADGDAIGVELGDPEVWVDVISPDPSSPEAAGAEAAFAVLLPALLPEITGAFGEIPIPAFSGFALADVETELVGADDGHLVISGDLGIE
jgi:hypothetical protein